MVDGKLERIFKGNAFTVIHCEGALESLNEALGHVGLEKGKSFKRGIAHQIQRLADGHRMSKENFPQEGDLPKRKGQIKAKNFNALKRKPIRGYCWLSDTYPNTYYISHYVFKNYDKLKECDTLAVCRNWKRIEEGGYEY